MAYIVFSQSTELFRVTSLGGPKFIIFTHLHIAYGRANMHFSVAKIQTFVFFIETV